MKVWMIRAGEGAYLIDEFLSQGIATMGWNEVGDLRHLDGREKIKQALRMAYPDFKKGKTNQAASQLYKFAHEIHMGDRIVTYDPSLRIYHLGNVVVAYHFTPGERDHDHVLQVSWNEKISRDALSTRAKNHLGSIMTLFEISEEIKREFFTLLESSDKMTSIVDDEEEYDEITDDTIEKAHEFIKDKFQDLDWEQMQELVAGILRAMGYKTQISKKGPDRGRDVIASPDGLGLEEPRIIVEVKHRNSAMGANEIRSFTGGLRTRDKGLYVSIGGFSKEAKYEAERSNIPVTLVDADALV